MGISRDPLLRLEESLLHGSNVIILGDLTCNLIGGDPNGNALSDFIRLLVYHNSSKPQ